MGDIVDIKEPEKKESNSEDIETEELAEDDEDEVAPKFVCGLVLSLMPDGKGIVFGPVEHKEYSRVATDSDILMMCSAGAEIASSIITSERVMKGIQGFKDMRRAMNKLGTH